VAVGCQNAALQQNTPSGGSFVLVDQPAEDLAASHPLGSEIGDGVVGSGWVESSSAVRSASVVVSGVVGEHRSQVPFAEVEHPVSDLRPDGAHEPLRERVRARIARRDLHCGDGGVGEDCVERIGELAGASLSDILCKRHSQDFDYVNASRG